MAESIGNQQASGLFIVSLDVEGQLVVETSVPEIQLRESLLSPTLESSAIIQSTIHTSWERNFDNLKGRVIGFQLASPAFEDDVLQVEQIIFRMENRKRINEQTEEYTLQAVDPTIITNHSTRISKMYKCQTPDVVVTEAMAAIDAQVDIEKTTPARDYAATNIHPLQVLAEQADVALFANEPDLLHYMTFKDGGTHHFRSIKSLTQEKSKFAFVYNEKGFGLQLGDPHNIMYYEFPCDFDLLSDILNGVTITGERSASAITVNPTTASGNIVRGKVGENGGMGGNVAVDAQTSTGTNDDACGSHVEDYAALRQARLALIQPSNIALKITVPFNPILHAGDMIDVTFWNKELGALLYGTGNYLIVTLTHNMKAGGYGVTNLDLISKTAGDGTL